MGEPGDANCDGAVNAADATAAVIALASGTNCEGADVDGDGTITALDVSLTVEKIFGQ